MEFGERSGGCSGATGWCVARSGGLEGAGEGLDLVGKAMGIRAKTSKSPRNSYRILSFWSPGALKNPDFRWILLGVDRFEMKC